MFKSSYVGVVGAPRRLRREQNGLRCVREVFQIDDVALSCAFDGWPALLLSKLRQERDLQLQSRNEELLHALVVLMCARERLWALYEKAPIGYVTLDEQGVLLAATLRFATPLASEGNAIVGHALSELIEAEDHACRELQSLAFREGAARRACEPRIRRADRESVWTAPALVPVAADDATKLVHSAVSDIAQSRYADEERVRMRDCMLQSQKMAAVGTLAVGLAHDINNVLGMVQLFASSLERRLPSGDPAKEDAADIVAAALHGKELTQNLLNFSHQSSRREELLRPSEMIARLVVLLRRMVAKRIAIKPLVDDAVAAITCDSSRFMQMLMNLCLNAVDAIPNQGTITIAAGNVPPEDAELHALVGRTSIPYVRIEVADDGVGMDADTRQHAFEPFFTTKEMGKGTGLGLSMVYGEVQELHGVVRIDSQPNRGTSIHILLPAPPGTVIAPLVTSSAKTDARVCHSG